MWDEIQTYITSNIRRDITLFCVPDWMIQGTHTHTKNNQEQEETRNKKKMKGNIPIVSAYLQVMRLVTFSIFFFIKVMSAYYTI